MPAQIIDSSSRTENGMDRQPVRVPDAATRALPQNVHRRIVECIDTCQFQPKVCAACKVFVLASLAHFAQLGCYSASLTVSTN